MLEAFLAILHRRWRRFLEVCAPAGPRGDRPGPPRAGRGCLRGGRGAVRAATPRATGAVGPRKSCGAALERAPSSAPQRRPTIRRVDAVASALDACDTRARIHVPATARRGVSSAHRGSARGADRTFETVAGSRTGVGAVGRARHAHPRPSAARRRARPLIRGCHEIPLMTVDTGGSPRTSPSGRIIGCDGATTSALVRAPIPAGRSSDG